MSAILCLLALSVLTQLLTCVLAFRLNWVHGWRWPWVLISLGILVMMIRRSFTLYRVWQGDAIGAEELSYDGGSLQAATAITSLVASLLFLAGVSLIGSMFAKLARAEELLLEQNVQLESNVQEAQTQFEAAHEIQQSLYPLASPKIPGYEIAGRSLPALAAGGDYFDFLPMRGGAWGIAVGDVSGHGLGPALMMAQVHAYVRTLARIADDPSEILRAVNSLLIPPEMTGRFVTLFFARFDPAQNRIQYTSAAHPAFLKRQDGSILPLETASPPLGLLENLEIPPPTTLDLADRESLIIPTDGLMEAVSPSGEMHGVKRLFGAIASQEHQSADSIIEKLQADLKAFTNLEHFLDDVTLVILKRLAA